MSDTDKPKRRRPLVRFAALFFLVAAVLISTALMRHPDTPLPSRWNVFEPLKIADPVTPLTTWKLDWATQDPVLCTAILAQGAGLTPMPDLTVSEDCGITGRVTLARVGQTRIGPLETSCATALRTAMWEHHALQPAARDLFGQDLKRIRHMGSYNCRKIAGTRRMSTHATASAIDISGFDLADGTRIRLRQDWTANDAKSAFLRAARDSSCEWFDTTLGPDYNAAHADHFHLQNKGWGTCR